MKKLITLLLALLFTLQGTVAQTRETWRSVRTNNLFVIGNADPEKLRQVAAWLEFFHSAFARLISRNVLEASVPTTVIIFRDDASFTPFKPTYQGRPANIAGFFQPGDDMNYIAISLDPNDRDPFSTTFHEYVHLHLKDNVPNTPLWLNEGLAELYGALQFSGNEALLGAPILPYVNLLRQQELLPLKTLFSIGTNSPHYNEQDKSGVFYGESWALVHYLMLSDRGRLDQFRRFMQQIGRGETSEKAIQESFGVSLAVLEEELQTYVRRTTLSAQRIASVDNPQAYASYTAMQRASLSEGEANHYLGDLLLHIGRDADAERYFKQAIALDPGYLPAYASLGQLYVHQRRYADAKKYLQKATTSPQSYLIHYLYAYVLSREGVTPNGVINEYSRENATVMREQLLRSIKLAPDYAPSHYLLAVVDLVSGEHLDEALEMAQKAQQLKPALKKDVQILLDALSEIRAGGGRAAATASVNSATIAEPPQTGSSRMLGGDASGMALRDGQTIDSSGSLPSLDEVLKKYTEAMGGTAAIKAVTSRVIKGTVDLVGVSRGGSFETHAQAPNKSLSVINVQATGTVKVGYNGRVGWSRSAEGLRMLKGLELASLQRETDFYGPIRMKENYAKVTLPGRSKIGFREVYVIELQPAAGALEKIYLDVQTYLPVRVNAVQTVGAYAVPVEIYFDDWRDVDGVKYPFRLTQSMLKATLAFTVTEIRHGVAIDPKIFEP